MKQLIIILGTAMFLATSCQKELYIDEPVAKNSLVASEPNSVNFVEYNIRQGEQYCDKSTLQKVEYEELKFIVRFDSSAIYRTIDPANQSDINKLYGFSDNNAQHHLFSARFGWRWNPKEGLCLFAYTYNNSVRTSKLLSVVTINEDHTCSIKVTPNSYVFTLDGKQETMLRESTTTKASGYQLFPYFGGDEFAPHDIKIKIKELK